MKEGGMTAIACVIMMVLAVFCFGYYLFAAGYAGIHSAFLWFWLLAGMGFTGISVLLFLHARTGLLSKLPKAVRVAGVVLVVVGVVVYLLMEVLIASKMQAQGQKGAGYVVVLGAQVRGTRVTKSLKKRLDAAYDYLQENPQAKVVCTGGQGTGEDVPEAVAMGAYLEERGIEKDRILLEDRSVSTYENLKFTLALLGEKDAKVVIVTNNFHVYRALFLAKQVGFTDVSGVAADSDARLQLNYMVREGFALLKEFVFSGK